ncbi:hypothetical protein [Brevundimonas sp. FT23042]|uniref:hypothetical protein n=1 Tax=Brevundimonas sp. FT23042 TaxID=3393749 RepID=UPI003B586CBA
MLRTLAAATVAVVCLAATPGQANMNAAFGNTVVSRYADGGWVRHYFDADGSYRARWSDGTNLTGRWRVQGERVCLNNIRPRFMWIDSFCQDMIEADVGDTWQSRDPLGRRVQNSLVAGRH